jgi:Ca2+-binding EF-hand superfamily protein
LLDYQIKSRDRYLKNYVQAFKQHDTDNNGILNEEEFINLLEDLNIYSKENEEQAVSLLNAIDPYNNKQITFSETVALFSMVNLIF